MLIQLRGVEAFTTDFDMAMLMTYIGPLVSNLTSLSIYLLAADYRVIL